MFDQSLIILNTPNLQDPLLVGGFEGWGNALDVSVGMVDFLIRTLNAEEFARIKPDPFFNYEQSRPQIEIKDGGLKSVAPPEAVFCAATIPEGSRDLVILKAQEPHLQWYRFSEIVLSICKLTGVRNFATIGSMYDDVLHTDMMVSAIASDTGTLQRLKGHRVVAANYTGPSAIQSFLHHTASELGLNALSLWCHCPYYLQGTTHFGLLSHLALILSTWGGVDLDTEELDDIWRELNRQIQEIIEKNPELQTMIHDLRKAKVKGSWNAATRHDNVIHLEDFLKPG